MSAPPPPPLPSASSLATRQQLPDAEPDNARADRARVPASPTDTTAPRPATVDEWLSTSVRHSIHHYKAAVMSLAQRKDVDLQRASRGWNVLVGLIRAAGWDCTAGLAPMVYSEVLAPMMGAAPGSAMPLLPLGPLARPNAALVDPHTESMVLRRLLADQAACYVAHRTVNGVEEFVCNDRMAEEFASMSQLQAVHQHFRGILRVYLWCTFVVPEDRPKLMRALASIAYERGNRMHVDCIIRCVDRAGQHVRCLASVGLCVEDDKNAILILRLWPLVTRNMGVRVLLPANGQRGEAAAMAATAAPAVGPGRSIVFSSISNNSSTASTGSSSSSSSNNNSSSGHARPPPPQPLPPQQPQQKRPAGAGALPVPFRHYWAPPPAPPPPPAPAPPPEAGSKPSQPSQPPQPPVAPQPPPQSWLLLPHGHAIAPYEAVAPRNAEEGGDGIAREGELEDIDDDMWNLLSESLESP